MRAPAETGMSALLPLSGENRSVDIAKTTQMTPSRQRQRRMPLDYFQ